MKNFINKFYVGCGAVLASVGSAVAAEGSAYDFSGAITELTNVKSGLETFASSALPILGGIAAAFMVFWLGKMIFRLVKGWASKAG